jgi:D-glycero-D-manno-heptose 1,7-bisphosphate phosphatase
LLNKKSIKAVFLDRDGVLNKAVVKDGKPYPPVDLGHMEIIPGVELAAKQLRDRGFELIVITNQPDVARGTTSRNTVETINQFLQHRLSIAEFRTCYHDSMDGCSCRKPLPGAILEAARSREIDLSQSFMVGDRWRDIQAGVAAGVKTVFIDYGYDEKQPLSFDFKATSLLDAVPFILGEVG